MPRSAFACRSTARCSASRCWPAWSRPSCWGCCRPGPPRPAIWWTRLKDGTPGAGVSRRRVRAALVVVQVALSVVLLAAAGLCVRSLINARSIRPGFNTSGVLLASLDLYPHATSNEVVRSLYRSLLDGVGRAPGVSAVTMASSVPLGLDSGSWTTITVDGYQPAADERVSAAYNFVGPDYFRTLQTPILRGRDIASSDDERGERVVIVNEALAKRYWPGREALGSRVRFWDEQWMRVVGVVANTKQKELNGWDSPYLYVPMLQFPAETITLHVRTTGDVASLSGAVRDAVSARRPRLVALQRADVCRPRARRDLPPAPGGIAAHGVRPAGARAGYRRPLRRAVAAGGSAHARVRHSSRDGRDHGRPRPRWSCARPASWWPSASSLGTGGASDGGPGAWRPADRRRAQRRLTLGLVVVVLGARRWWPAWRRRDARGGWIR